MIHNRGWTEKVATDKDRPASKESDSVSLIKWEVRDSLGNARSQMLELYCRQLQREAG